MSYASRNGRRPAEYASKSAHGYVIRDADVADFLTQCDIPKRAANVVFSPNQCISLQPVPDNPIRTIIAVDGGFTEVPVQTEFPSATVCFFQFGALIFSIEDLERLEDQRFIDPDDMTRLKNIQRLKLTLPIRHVTMKAERNLTHSIRRAVYDFFRRPSDDGTLIDTLRWLIFQEYSTPLTSWILATCPYCPATHIPLIRSRMSSAATFACTHCGGSIYLTDVFRLHEAVDDHLGAGGILGYVTTTFEQIIVAHLIRLILRTKPALLNQILFIKDGPLAFFGQTANMHKPMRALVQYLFAHHNLYLAGLEKSGSFVEHADEIKTRLNSGTVLILDNDYIYRYIIPGHADSSNPYGRTTYYGSKVIFKTRSGSMYVATLPTTDILLDPTTDDLRNLHVIVTNLEKLKCDMYDNALIPVALINKLVSLANHPSSRILQKFAIGTISH
jgi:hypothetical protein